MEKPAQNIQESFLNNARKEKGVVTIYLLSGVKLSGRIRSFDKYSLVLETNNQEQLIFKHAISTVVTVRSGHTYPAGPATGSHPAHPGHIPRRLLRTAAVRRFNSSVSLEPQPERVVLAGFTHEEPGAQGRSVHCARRRIAGRTRPVGGQCGRGGSGAAVAIRAKPRMPLR